MIEPTTVIQLTQELVDSGVEWCIIGGWGVDALLGEHTRPHKDLDVLVQREKLSATLQVLGGRGFRYAYSWNESRLLSSDGPCAGHDSAFVMSDDEDREIDVHVYDVRGHALEVLWDAELALQPDDLDTRGVVAGVIVRCATAAGQLELHRGYEMPESHRHDLERLRILGSGGAGHPAR